MNLTVNSVMAKLLKMLRMPTFLIDVTLPNTSNKSLLFLSTFKTVFPILLIESDKFLEFTRYFENVSKE